ncbi:MAG: hypothetical protein J6A75_09670 [Lachnospiraceae bacterium]|nr:hypothetical protein [Lachnospiraceae bacterium]
MGVSLLRGWYNAHNECLGSIAYATFIRAWIPEEILKDNNIVKDKSGKAYDGEKYSISAEYRNRILDEDTLIVTKPKKTDNEKKKEEKERAQKEFLSVENAEAVKKAHLEYAKTILVCNDQAIKAFFKRIEEVLRNCDRNPISYKMLINYLQKVDRYNAKSIQKFFYYYSYFAIAKYFPADFAYQKYDDYEADFNEYRRCVFESYGIFSLQGMATLYALAEREDKPNICALYAKGQLEYYGRGPSGVRNIPEAYNCYEKIIQINNSHPMALWSVSYLKLYYEKIKEDCENKGHPFTIEKLERAKRNAPEKWYKHILEDVITAISFGSAAAENLLGRIIEADDELFPGIYKEDYKIEDAEEHYKRSSEMGYANAYINLFNCKCKKSEKCKSKEKQKELYLDALEDMKKAAKLGVSYAANKMSGFYREGVQGILEPDEEKSFYYAKCALRYARLMSHEYWPFYNIVEYFYANENSLHYDKIDKDKQLEYLDVAMEAAEGIEKKKYEEIKEKVDKLREKVQNTKNTI